MKTFKLYSSDALHYRAIAGKLLKWIVGNTFIKTSFIKRMLKNRLQKALEILN